jgi:hypothetical protein
MIRNRQEIYEINFYSDITFLAGVSIFYGLNLLGLENPYFNQKSILISSIIFALLVVLFMVFKWNIIKRQNSAIVFQKSNSFLMILLAIPLFFSVSLNLNIPYLILKIQEKIGFDISSIITDSISRLLHVFLVDIIIEESIVFFWTFFIILQAIGCLLLLLSYFLAISKEEITIKGLIDNGFVDIENKIWHLKPVKRNNPGLVIDLRSLGIILITIFVFLYLPNLLAENISDIFIEPSKSSGILVFIGFYMLLFLGAGRGFAIASILSEMKENTGVTFRLFS